MNKILSFITIVFSITACTTLPPEHAVRNGCDDHPFTFGSKEFEVKGVRYSDAQLVNKSILLMPPTGGANLTDRNIADRLCRAGFDVYIVNEWSGQKEDAVDLRLHDRLYKRALQAMEITLEKLPQGFVGTIGTSVGATYVAVAMNKIPRLDAAFTIVGGVPIPAVIVYSDQSEMKDLKKRRFEKFKFKTDAEYLAALEKEFPLEPTKTEPLFKGKKLGMMISIDDKTVPTIYQQQLQKLWNPKVYYEIDGGHVGSIVTSWWKHEKDIVQFFMDAADGK